MIRPFFRYTGMIATGLAVSLMVAAPADARRGGSFGSRGMRTYSAPRQTSLAPGYVSPVQRSMTSPAATPSYAPSYGQPARSFGSRFGGFGGGLVGGLLAGGLIGAMMGHGMGGGWGGGGGGLLALIQLAILGGIIWFVFGLFRRKQTYRSEPGYDDRSTFDRGYAPTTYPASVPASRDMQDIPITAEDQNAFERLLIDVQDAFGREDHGRLRERCTPEVMSYLSEELSQNATHGRRNDVSGTRLIDADVSEAWREGAIDYATIAMRYESIDVMRDRATGAVVEGDATRPTETVELWTFVRSGGSAWKLSAIQEA
jgi:predicted lipid-binding transport protein (Tim44 family)